MDPEIDKDLISDEKLYEMGFAQYELGCYREAEELFILLCGRSPHSPLIWYALGASQFMLHEYSKAKSSIEFALSLDPEFIEGQLLLAEIFISNDEIADNRGTIEQIVKTFASDTNLTPRNQKRLEWIAYQLNSISKPSKEGQKQ